MASVWWVRLLESVGVGALVAGAKWVLSTWSGKA